jgi:hypothetical protein
MHVNKSKPGFLHLSSDKGVLLFSFTNSASACALAFAMLGLRTATVGTGASGTVGAGPEAELETGRVGAGASKTVAAATRGGAEVRPGPRRESGTSKRLGLTTQAFFPAFFEDFAFSFIGNNTKKENNDEKN